MPDPFPDDDTGNGNPPPKDPPKTPGQRGTEAPATAPVAPKEKK